MIGVGLIGYGYWGPKLARNLAASGARLAAVCDQREDRLRLALAQFPEAEPARRWSELLRNPGVEAVVLATPPTTHFEIGRGSLAAGKHVLIEKPITTTSDDAARLIEAAARRGLTLMVDHTFLYTDSIQQVRRMVAEGSLGDLVCYDGVRIGPRPASTDVDVVWDLATHDLAIIDYLFGLRPDGVAAAGIVPAGGPPVEDAHLTLKLGSRLVRLHVSWLSPVKVRRILIAGSRRTIVYDEMTSGEKIQVQDREASADGYPEAARGEPPASRIAAGEALAAVTREFLDCIATGRRPVSDGEAGRHIVQILEVASASLAQGGRMLRFPDGLPM